MSKISDVTGVILAGGKSVRFGGNKAFAYYKGQPLVERVLHVLQKIFNDVVIVTNTPDDYAHLGVSVITDMMPHRGPLGGIMSALYYTTCGGVFAAACDMPLLNPFVIRQVVEKGKKHLAAVPEHNGQKEYLMSFYSKKLLSTMSLLVRDGRLSVAELCDQLTNIIWIPVEGDSWLNMNTKGELEALEKQHAR